MTSILARTLDLHQGGFSNAWTRDPLATGWASLLLERWNLDRSADFRRLIERLHDPDILQALFT